MLETSEGPLLLMSGALTGYGDSHQDHPSLHEAEAPPVRGLVCRGVPQGRMWRVSVRDCSKGRKPPSPSVVHSVSSPLGVGARGRDQFTGRDDQGHTPRAFGPGDMTMGIFEKFTLRRLLKGEHKEEISFSFTGYASVSDVINGMIACLQP